MGDAEQNLARRMMAENSRLHNQLVRSSQYVAALEETLSARSRVPVHRLRYNFARRRGLLQPINVNLPRGGSPPRREASPSN